MHWVLKSKLQTDSDCYDFTITWTVIWQSFDQPLSGMRYKVYLTKLSYGSSYNYLPYILKCYLHNGYLQKITKIKMIPENKR